jgi:hypothetical protein
VGRGVMRMLGCCQSDSRRLQRRAWLHELHHAEELLLGLLTKGTRRSMARQFGENWALGGLRSSRKKPARRGPRWTLGNTLSRWCGRDGVGMVCVRVARLGMDTAVAANRRARGAIGGTELRVGEHGWWPKKGHWPGSFHQLATV